MDTPVKSRIVLNLSPKTLRAFSQINKQENEEMRRVREYNLYWKERLERLLVDENYVIPADGLPFKSMKWKEIYTEVVATLDDPELMFGGSHFLAELGLYLHVGDPNNKPRLLSLAIEKGYEDIVRKILVAYEGDISGFTNYPAIYEHDTMYHDPIEDSIFYSSKELIKDLVDAAIEIEYQHGESRLIRPRVRISSVIPYVAMAMGRDDLFEILTEDDVDERLVSIIQDAREGFLPENLEDNYHLALCAALFSNQLVLVQDLLGMKEDLGLDIQILKSLITYGSVAAVELLSDIAGNVWEVLAKTAISKDRLDMLDLLLRWKDATEEDVMKVSLFAQKENKMEAYQHILRLPCKIK